jgi:hypothetical protein
MAIFLYSRWLVVCFRTSGFRMVSAYRYSPPGISGFFHRLNRYLFAVCRPVKQIPSFTVNFTPVNFHLLPGETKHKCYQMLCCQLNVERLHLEVRPLLWLLQGNPLTPTISPALLQGWTTGPRDAGVSGWLGDRWWALTSVRDYNVASYSINEGSPPSKRWVTSLGA